MLNQQRLLLKSLRAHAITIHRPEEHIENWIWGEKKVELNLLKGSFWLDGVAQIATTSPMIGSDHWSDEGRRQDFREKTERKGGIEV